MAIQFWDTSAVVALMAQERHTPRALMAIEEGSHFLAWSWLQVESYSAMVRRNIGTENIGRLKAMWKRFDFLNLVPEDFPSMEKLFQKHRLRSADAGHLHCLKLAKKLHPHIVFICFDDELSKAAQAEGIKVFS